MSQESAVVEELKVVLFNQPSTASPTRSTSHISESTLSELASTLQQLQDANSSSQFPCRTQFLDNPAHSHVASLTFSTSIPMQTLRQHPAVKSFEQDHSVQLVFQRSKTYNTPTRLAVFDMDSTIIQQEVIDLLAGVAGVEAQVSDITSRAMNGELDFSESLRERVALLEGLPADVFESLKPKVTLMSGAEVLLRVLKRLGVKTALLSGGFTPLARWVAGRLGIDHVHANDLAAENALLTGLLAPDTVIVDSGRKKQLLLEIAKQEGVETHEAILAVGDGANDLPMLWTAGLGVAVNAKPKVQIDAPARLNGPTALLDVLYLIGLNSEKIDELAEDG